MLLIASDCDLIDGGYWEEDLDTSPLIAAHCAVQLGARADDGRDPILHCGQVRVR